MSTSVLTFDAVIKHGFIRAMPCTPEASGFLLISTSRIFSIEIEDALIVITTDDGSRFIVASHKGEYLARQELPKILKALDPIASLSEEEK